MPTEEMHDVRYFPKHSPGKVCHNRTPEAPVLKNRMLSFEFSRHHSHDITRIGIMLSTGAIIVESPLKAVAKCKEIYSVTCLFGEELIGNYTTPCPPILYGQVYEFLCAKTKRLVKVYGNVVVKYETI